MVVCDQGPSVPWSSLLSGGCQCQVSSGDCVCTLGCEVIRFIVILSFVYGLCCDLRRGKVKAQVGGRQVSLLLLGSEGVMI